MKRIPDQIERMVATIRTRVLGHRDVRRARRVGHRAVVCRARRVRARTTLEMCISR